MLEILKKKNPNLTFFDVNDAAFGEYGVVLHHYDLTELESAAKQIALPKEGSVYSLSVDSFEQLSLFEQIADEIFGGLPTQLGYCYGHNRVLNALEWHCCSEFNVAVTDLVLLLARRQDIQNGRLDSSCIKAFFVPAGTAVEIFATTLHFCPCEVSDSGFGCVVGLLKNTNALHDVEKKDKLVFKKNKWLLVHDENTALIEKGCVAGIGGENYRITD